jgi:hypothetical protein
MTKSEWFDHLVAETKAMVETSRAKNADYTGKSDNPFANFQMVEAMDITDAVTGVLVRMADKFARLKSFNQMGTYQVKDESEQDTCRDLAVYSLILGALFKDRRRNLQPVMFIDEEPEYVPGWKITHGTTEATRCMSKDELDAMKADWERKNDWIAK